MGIPSFDEFIEPLLRVLFESSDGLATSDAYAVTADRVGLSADLRTELLPSGRQEVYKNRIGWAHDRLKRAGLSESAGRGVWCLTAEGRDIASKYPNSLPSSQLDEIARPRKYQPNSPAEHVGTSTAEQERVRTPQEQIDAAVAELYESTIRELLELISQQSDLFFERLVLNVLQAMGYGAGQGQIKHSGGSNDGGIDGVISLDHLGLEKVYVQAKKWSNTVGRPELQAFSGALRGQQASKGVFITTSTFSSHATEFARMVSDSIALVDGERLAKLMIDHGVGVQTRHVLKIVEVDGDYFEDD